MQKPTARVAKECASGYAHASGSHVPIPPTRVTMPRQSDAGLQVPDRRAPLRSLRSIGMMAGIVLGLMVAGCSSTVIRHGHYFRDGELQQIQPGMSQDQVRQTLGTPTTTASVGTGNAFYYISSTDSQTAFFAPKEVDRRVAAVYFTRAGAADRVAEYG